MREKLRTMSPAELTLESKMIREQLTFQADEKVAIFAGIATEPRLLDLIAQYPKTNWYLPRITGQSSMEFVKIDPSSPLKPGPFGILEPSGSDVSEVFDTVICPGIAFTREGKRLGQGGGFYDRFLKNASPAKIIGVAFRVQLLDDLPTDEHDIFMHRVVTS